MEIVSAKQLESYNKATLISLCTRVLIPFKSAFTKLAVRGFTNTTNKNVMY